MLAPGLLRRRPMARLAAALLAIVAALPAGAQADRAAQVFEAFDADRNGRISQQEFQLRKVEILFSRSSTRGATLRFEDTLVSRAAFDAIDADRDGLVTASDIVGSPIFSFGTFDTNRDGHIDREELAQQLHRLRR
jgi:Ca2+-binding EF-hand superfamily protein